MRKLRWASDGGVWDLDVESPVTMEGTARPVPGDPLPLGLSRGGRITRPKQLDFMHRFMSSPLVASFSGDPSLGDPSVFLHRANSFHIRDCWSATILQQLHVQKFLSFVKDWAASGRNQKDFWRKNVNGVLDALSIGLGSEFMATPDSSLLFEAYDVGKSNRCKAVFTQKLPQHDLTVEAAGPGLFVDGDGQYWDVPLSTAIDLASVGSSSGLSYRLCLQHKSGQPRRFGGGSQDKEAPLPLLPGLCAKAAFAFKKNIDMWRKKEGKLKMVLPYDVLLSDPHFSGSATIGTVMGASMGKALACGDGLGKRKFSLLCKEPNVSTFGDIFASVSCAAQIGNFQRLFLDLTRLNARLDFPSGLSFTKGAASLARGLHSTDQQREECIRSLFPDLTISLQQQIVGPFSFRADYRIAAAAAAQGSKPPFRVADTVLAIDWALQVLGSARATAWYSPRIREAMVELRFFEA